jgi:dsRNA-specific ribonuclease
VNVIVNKNVAGKGVGKNKKIAEQNAAKDALIQEGCLNE